MSFRVNAKNVLITYPQTDFEHDDLYNFCATKYPIEYAIIAKERHQDGNFHMHAQITFKRKVNITNAKLFDFNDRHPNIGSCKNLNATREYCKKDGNYKEYFNEACDEDDILTKCRNMDPDTFFLDCVENKISLGMYQEAIRLTNATCTVNTDFSYEGKIESSFLQIIKVDWLRERKSIVIVGPAGCGKTTLALRDIPKPALVVTHLDTLRSFNEKYHRGIVFDDMSFSHLPRESQIHIVCRELSRQIHVRYGTAIIPSGIPKIFTANHLPFTNDPSIMRRINIINA